MIERDFNSIIFSPIMRTNEVKRCSGTYLQEDESLAQHITDTLLMSYMIAKRLQKNGEEIDLGLLLEKGLLHDIDEIATGDIPHNTKYATDTIKSELDNVAKIAIQKFSKMDPSLEDLPEIWETAKDGKEGVILKLCDMLCVVRKAIVEIELYHNMLFLKVSKELTSNLVIYRDSLHLEELFEQSSSVEFIESIIDYSIYLIDSINLENMSVSEKYNITTNILTRES